VLSEELASSGGRLEMAVAGERRCQDMLGAQEEEVSRLNQQIEELKAEVRYSWPPCIPPILCELGK